MFAVPPICRPDDWLGITSPQCLQRLAKLFQRIFIEKICTYDKADQRLIATK
jgi:hypothetical protein